MQQYDFPVLDILELDVEGAEQAIFRDNYDGWLPKTRMLIIELHEFMAKGSSDSFWKAIRKYNFSQSESGENLCFINQDWNKRMPLKNS